MNAFDHYKTVLKSKDWHAIAKAFYSIQSAEVKSQIIQDYMLLCSWLQYDRSLDRDNDCRYHEYQWVHDDYLNDLRRFAIRETWDKQALWEFFEWLHEREWLQIDSPIDMAAFAATVYLMPLLEFVSLDNQKIENVILLCNELSHLEFLQLRQCNLTSFPVAEVYFPHLSSLTLDGNALEDLPMELKAPQLKSIYLRENQFREIPAVLSAIPTLESIGVTGNPLAGKLDDSFFRMSGVKVLHLSDCRLTDISALGHAKALRTLYVGGNPLNKLPRSLGELQSLSIDAAQVPLFSGKFTGSCKLNHLWIEGPEACVDLHAIERLRDLEHLNIRAGSIVGTEVLGRFRKLRTLWLRCKDLQAVPSSIFGLIHLESIGLNCEDLEDISGDWERLPKLKFLALTSDRLKEVTPYLFDRREIRLSLFGDGFSEDYKRKLQWRNRSD